MAAVGNYEVVSEEFTFANGVDSHTIEAPAGKKVLSAGFSFSGSGIAVQQSFPETDGSAWTIVGANNSSAQTVTLYAVTAEMG
jgi:hypothetical protein